MMPLNAQNSHEISVSFTAGSSNTVLILWLAQTPSGESTICSIQKDGRELMDISTVSFFDVLTT
jgi:hypothetical protein